MHSRLVPYVVADLIELRFEALVLGAVGSEFGLKHVVFYLKLRSFTWCNDSYDAVVGIELNINACNNGVPANGKGGLLPLGVPVNQPEAEDNLYDFALLKHLRVKAKELRIDLLNRFAPPMLF